MRTLNVRLALILMAACFVFFGSVYLLHGFQVRRNAHLFLDEAKLSRQQAAEAAKANNAAAAREANREAARYLSWYAALNPDNLDVLEELGMLQAELAYENRELKSANMFRQAFSRLETLVRQSPERTKPRRKLVEMAMFAGRYQDAKDHLQGYLLRESPNDAELLQLFGECQVATANYHQAQQTFEKAIEQNPAQLHAYARLAVLLRVHLNQPKVADAWMKKLVEVNPDAYMAHLLRGHYLITFNMRDEAFEEVMKAMKLAPEKPEVLELAASTALAMGQVDQAREYAAQGIKLHPNMVSLYTVMAEVESRSGSRQKALAVLEEGLKATGRNINLLWTTANVLIDDGKLKESQKIIDEMRSPEMAANVPQNLLNDLVGYLLARIDFAEGRWLSASQGLEKGRATMLHSPRLVAQIDLWLGNCYGQLGNRDQEEKAYRRALTIDPSFGAAKTALLQLLRRSGKVDEAMERMKEWDVGHQTGAAGAVVTAQMLFQKTMRQPSAERDWQAVETALAAARAAAPDAASLTVMHVEMLLAQGKSADAEKLLQEAYEKNPKQTAFLLNLAQLAIREQQWDKAEQLLQKSEAVLGDVPAQRIARAQYLASRYGKDSKDSLRKLANDLGRYDDVQRLQLWMALFDKAIQIGDTQQADSLSKLIADKQPNNAQIRYMRCERAMQAKDQAAMEEALKEIEQVAGRGWYWNYGQAVLLRMRAKDSKDPGELYGEALKHLAKARELRSDWPRIPLEQAIVYDQMGNATQALKTYLEAVDMGERSVYAVGRSIELLFATQQFAEADRRLRQLEKEVSSLPASLVRASVEVALQQGDFNRALELVQKVSSAQTTDYSDYLWLGRVAGILGSRLRAQEKTQEAAKLSSDAEAALRRAAELEPKRPEAWVMLVQVFCDAGKMAEAEAVVQEAGKKLSAEASPLTLAQCFEIMRKTDDAEKQYTLALTAAPENLSVVRAIADFFMRTGKYARAEALLTKVIEGKVAGQPADIAWARRQKATVFAALGGYQNHQKARELIEENLASPQASLADRRLKIQLAAADASRAQREEAIRMLEQMIDDRVATADDRYLLARLYVSVDNWVKASDQLRSLAVANDREPRYLIALVEGMLHRGATSDADLYLVRLEKIAPDWFPTIRLRAELLAAENEPQRAIDLLFRFIDRTNALPADRGTRLRLVADELDQLSRRLAKSNQKEAAAEALARAETLYEAYVKQYPERNLILVAFLGRQGKFDQAIDVFESQLDKRTAQEFVQVSTIFLQSGKVTPQQLERWSRTVQAAFQKFNRPLSLLAVMGDLQMRRGQYAEAENHYRDILAKHAKNFVAMNNLAVLLALQGVKLDEALNLVNQAIDIAGPAPQMLDSRASVYIAMRQPEKALADLAQAMRDRESPEQLFHQARAHALAGDEKAAKAAFDKAVEKGLTREILSPLEAPAFDKFLNPQ